MFRFLQKYWFFTGIALMIATAFSLPGLGALLREYKVLNIGIFLAFLVSGLTLETSSILQQLKGFRVLAAALTRR
jgi:sodium/bile acid cotransporter 7